MIVGITMINNCDNHCDFGDHSEWRTLRGKLDPVAKSHVKLTKLSKARM